MKSLFLLPWKSLWSRRLPNTLTIASIAISVMLFLGVSNLKESVHDSFNGAISKVDLIVGPRSGAINLLLYSVFHIGTPSHLIATESLEHLKKDPSISWVVPFNLGDGFKGFAVVGTTTDFFHHYKIRNGKNLELSSGNYFSKKLEAVIGHDVANSLSLRIGDKIILSHGHTEEGDGFETHEDHPFTVSGILSSTSTPIDQSVYTSIIDLASIHLENSSESHHDHHSTTHEEEDHDHHSSFEVTPNGLVIKLVSGAFIGLKDRSQVLRLQREINGDPQNPLLAVIPGVTLNELWRNLAVFENSLRWISAAVVFASFLGLFVALFISSSQRRHEMVIMRAVGASPGKILALFGLESFFLVLCGIGTGLLGAIYGLKILKPYFEKRFSIPIEFTGLTKEHLLFTLGLLCVAGIVSVLAVFKTYWQALHDGFGNRI